MRNLNALNKYRVPHFSGEMGDSTCGSFVIPSVIDKCELRIIASSEDGWDHVSISRFDRIPLWIEMEQIKRMFFRDNETAMQLHVPITEHVNIHPNVLHIWRPNDGRTIPLPPVIMI